MLANNADITILSPTLSHGFPFLLTVLHSHWPLKTVRIGLVFVSLWTLNSLFSAWLLVQQASSHPFISTYIVTFRLHQSVCPPATAHLCHKIVFLYFIGNLKLFHLSDSLPDLLHVLPSRIRLQEAESICSVLFIVVSNMFRAISCT